MLDCLCSSVLHSRDVIIAGELSKQRRLRETAEAEEFGYEIDESEYAEDMYYENLGKTA